MPTCISVFCIIGYFVLLISILCKNPRCVLIHLILRIFIRKVQFTLRKRSSLLDDQTIGRNMFRIQLRHLPKVRTPCLSSLSGDINILKACFSCPLITPKKFFICMNSSKHPQFFRIRGLQSQTQTVDSCFSVSFELRKINCAGI